MTAFFHMHKARLETLVDGVFAIAMTILVLEVKVPEINDTHSARMLWTALLHHGYVITAYFFSFAMLAVFWVWHHRLVEKLRVFDLPVLVVTLTFLALICFFPFAAALLGRYPTNLTALMVYVPLTGLIVLLQALLFKVAMQRGLLNEGVTPAAALAVHKRNLIGCAVFFFASVPTAMRLHLYAFLVPIAAGLVFVWAARRHRLNA